MIKRKVIPFLVPILSVGISSLLFFTTLDAKLSDLFQRVLPSTQIRDDVIMVGIDDYTIENIASFPLPRNIYADCISVMEELGADSIVFDLTFSDKAPASVDDNFQPFWPDDAFESSLQKSKITYLSYILDNKTDVDEETKKILRETASVKNLEVAGDTVTQEYTGVTPTLPDFLQYAAGAGSVSTDPDNDNFYRRVNALAKYNGEYYGHLSIPAVLKKLGNPKIIVENRKITLENARIGGATKNLVIPRGNDGKFILKYPKMQFNDYNYISLYDIYRIAQLRMYMQEDGEEAYIDEYTKLYNELKSKLASAICIIGTCASSTSDYGVNLYESYYPLPGVHYTVANQILNGDFVGEAPRWVSVLYALVFALFIVFVSNLIKSTFGKIGAGFLTICVSSAILLLIYRGTKIYVGEAVPLVSALITYITTVVIGFLTASKDKKFITNAFSQCLSKDVVNQIVANPDSFKLGGENREMTAIFTDIQKFSSFSELLTASELVALLNYYLTEMSDIIMEEGGTIDKYEGDAIIALVGAPLKMEDHARRAVKAALKMKQSEKLMNAKIKEIASQPKPPEMDENLYSAFKIMVENGKEIFTRIGINSGEMIAGYMGSENKKNYTMMGNNVNLASRLEGVNKQYSTFGILVSEATYRQLGEEILCRRLDKVQVVNVNTPLTLYEPLVLKKDSNEKLLKYLAVWEEAMKNFDHEDYAASLEKFKSLSFENPHDKVAAYYVKLLELFFVKGQFPKEEDDFGVVYNHALKCFRLLSK